MYTDGIAVKSRTACFGRGAGDGVDVGVKVCQVIARVQHACVVATWQCELGCKI